MRNGISARILASSTCAQPEYLFLSVSPVKSRSFLFTVIYRPPKLGHLSAFQADFERLPLFLPQSSSEISILISTAPHTILIISLISVPATISTLYRTMTLTFSSSHTRIDHCPLSDQSQLVSHHQEPLFFLSSHDLIEVTLNLLVHRTPPRPISIRDYSKFDLLSFLQSLQK